MDRGKQAMLRIEFDSRTISLIPEGQQATLVEKTAEGWRSFAARCVQLDQAESN